MWYSIFYKFYFNLLPCFKSDSFWHHGKYNSIWIISGPFTRVHKIISLLYFKFLGCSHMYLLICYIATDISRNCSWPKPCWSAKLSMPHKCSASPHTWEKMVYGASCNYNVRRDPTLWIYIYWNVSSVLFFILFCYKIRSPVNNLSSSFCRPSKQDSQTCKSRGIFIKCSWKSQGMLCWFFLWDPWYTYYCNCTVFFSFFPHLNVIPVF